MARVASTGPVPVAYSRGPSWPSIDKATTTGEEEISMCRDLKTLSTDDLHRGLKHAIDDYLQTKYGSAAERFAVDALSCWIAALKERVHQEEARRGIVYIAGPMRGHPKFNFPAFNAAAYRLREEGWEVFNPAEADNSAVGYDVGAASPDGKELDAPGVTIRDCMARDCKFLCEKATHIYMLNGWEKSSGANAEFAVAKALGLHIMYEGDTDATA